MIEKPRLNLGRKFEQVRSGAKDVFLRDGYSGASVDDIARSAGVSKATLYSYFPEKQLMYREVLLDEMTRIADRSPIEIAPDSGPAEALPLMARQIAEWLVSGPMLQLHRTNIAEATRFPDVSRRYHATLTALLRDVVQAHLDRWVDQRLLRVSDTALAADQFVRLSSAVLHDRALLSDSDDSRDATIREISDGAARLFMAAHRGEDGQAMAAVS